MFPPCNRETLRETSQNAPDTVLTPGSSIDSWIYTGQVDGGRGRGAAVDSLPPKGYTV